MTEKIYEYRDEHNWFIGKWEGFNYLTCFGDDQAYEEAQDHFHKLVKGLGIDDLQVHVVKLTSHFHFLRFLVATINQQQGRALSIVQHQGAILVTENDKLLLVHLPKEGIEMATFFGQDKGLAGVGDTILIATKNEGKTKEFRKFFERFGYQVENLNNYPDLPDVAETGMTFEENARLKAETIAELTGKMVLADDSGLKVDALGGLPGVWSARFSGPEATDERNNSKLLHELAMVFEIKDRSAQFHCTLVMAAPNRESLVVEADWDGYIGMERRGENGFGYDPLFLVGETGKTAAELSLEEKNQISHRAQALEKLVEAFPVWQEQAKQS
ncbi:TPA: nucleoside-triphosphate diphosphatase [Streptococcus suis]|nr:nucleoside-triphosphate diphosphatase [Streptococcus suis]HEM3618096.1 nucleoside-triphosphate diphosphatase [Streptococcus suis]HEM3654105.1 nucleoside-triphosphate diphosphatase [Streptococcus suis]HEM3687104.1 nucleoside-triphosphate diphosphatase [Streptococcus suis]HEM3706161.1 nucleoside-triphosphate diphosphatase [Streptococcus suis]